MKEVMKTRIIQNSKGDCRYTFSDKEQDKVCFDTNKIKFGLGEETQNTPKQITIKGKFISWSWLDDRYTKTQYGYRYRVNNIITFTP